MIEHKKLKNKNISNIYLTFKIKNIKLWIKFKLFEIEN